MGARAAKNHGKLGPQGSAVVAAATAAEGDGDPAEGVVTPGNNRPELQAAVDPNDEANARERAVMSGGPADQGFSFEHDGKTFNSQEELSTHLKSVSDELAALKAARTAPATTEENPPAVRPAAPAVVVPPEDPIVAAMKDFNEDEFFKSPKAVMEKLLGKAVSISDQQLTQKYMAQKNMETFWNEFYDKNKDLKTKGEVVAMVMQENQGTLGPMTLDKVGPELAKLVRAKLVSWGLTTAAPSTTPKPRTRVEGGDTPATATNTGKQETPANKAPVVSTLSATIKARQAARRSAQTV